MILQRLCKYSEGTIKKSHGRLRTMTLLQLSNIRQGCILKSRFHLHLY